MPRRLDPEAERSLLVAVDRDCAVRPVQGNQRTTRLEIAFAAMFAALVAWPFFLIIGTHPGFGRVIAIRWFEMLVGVLMKTAAIAIVLSVLLKSC